MHGHRENWPVKSSVFRDWLTHRYLRETGSAPSDGALRLAIGTIAAKAWFEGPTENVHMRVGGDGDTIYLDQCDSEWRAIKIDADGWRVTIERGHTPWWSPLR